jgi:hypothetical protein
MLVLFGYDRGGVLHFCFGVGRSLGASSLSPTELLFSARPGISQLCRFVSIVNC